MWHISIIIIFDLIVGALFVVPCESFSVLPSGSSRIRSFASSSRFSTTEDNVDKANDSATPQTITVPSNDPGVKNYTEFALSTISSDEAKAKFRQIGGRLLDEGKDLTSVVSKVLKLSLKKDIDPEDIVRLCDQIDVYESSRVENEGVDTSFPPESTIATLFHWEEAALRLGRRTMLATMMREDYSTYVKTASFLTNRIPRNELPNVQDIPYPAAALASVSVSASASASGPFQLTTVDGEELVEDCALTDMKYDDSILDKTLLKIFRKLVETNTGGVTSEKAGIEGLLEQGRTFMVQGASPEEQHQMVRDTLGGLMTPVLPPFYRIFMAGIVPKSELLPEEWRGKQLGPWFYAPWLTSVVTPTFFQFLVGPSHVNYRQDGNLGGLVVEKCKFLQQSNCKGLCLHQCKLPAQQFFADELGVPLTVRPNFVTQECQWSFGETPLPPQEDPTFPKGCLVGCESRQTMKDDNTLKGALCDA